MGSSGSKPEQHIFNAEAPVRFSQSVLEGLQKDPETDTTRARNQELQVQTRVNSELARIRDSQSKRLEDLTFHLASSDSSHSKTTALDAAPSQRDPNSLVAHLSSPFYHDHSAAVAPAPSAPAPAPRKDLTSAKVQEEMDGLRQKLQERKKVEQPPKEVEQAREKVVQCLRMNDRRPLDCWREVEEFKTVVGGLEKGWIEKVGR